MKIRVCIVLAVAAAGAATVPAGAVVGGEPLEYAEVPWFAPVASCGGTLVAPDRLLTAAHCVGGLSPDQIGATAIGGQPRTVTRIAMHPGFRRKNGESYLDDVAINAPVSSVAPVTFAGAAAPRTRASSAPATSTRPAGHALSAQPTSRSSRASRT